MIKQHPSVTRKPKPRKRPWQKLRLTQKVRKELREYHLREHHQNGSHCYESRMIIRALNTIDARDATIKDLRRQLRGATAELLRVETP